MKKRLFVIFLCICLVVSGCNGKQNDKGSSITDKDGIRTAGNKETGKESEADKILETSKTSEVDKASGADKIVETGTTSDTGSTSGTDTETTTAKLLNLSNEWSLVQGLASEGKEYEEPDIEADVASYSIAKNLSNVENIGRFSGFSKKQKEMLAKNGFVVIPSSDARIYYTYDTNEYQAIPNFITSDVALHLYHQFYDKSLRSVEAGYLYQDLDLMTKQMLDKSLLLLSEIKDEKLKILQEKNVVYFMTARMLFTQTSKLSVKADQKLFDLANQEYKLCQKAGGYQKSPLFGFQFDYSQFKVRGHYTRSKELGRFFKTMMWFGTAPLAFTDSKGDLLYDNIYQALLISYTTFADSDTTSDAKLWSDIYQPTTQYVGNSDDVNVFDLNGLRLSVYGNSNDPNIFNEEAYQDKLAQAVKALPEPQIKASLITLSTPTGKQFRYMGQRYILDSDILQKLIDSKARPIPTSLDVMGVLGSNTAKDLLFNVYKPQTAWPKYTEKFSGMKKTVAAYDTDYWKTNLYSGWLWSLKDVLTEYNSKSKMPFFMRNKAWNYKSLNTALGSYTELKHDSVLYAKQPVAECGGPDDFADQHYVEPNIRLYSKLAYLTDFTVSILKQKGMMNEQLTRGVESYQKFLKLLIRCSEKELKNKPLSEDEKKQLLWSGGTIEDIILSFTYASSDGSEKEVTDMLATDIATCLGDYLTLGTGYFDQIYVVVPVKGKLYLSRGAVYSFYEFTGNTRLTDEEWWSLQGIHKVKADFGDYMEQGEPSKSLPKQPFWTKYFKTGSNHVKIEALDTDWNTLSE